MNRPLIFSSFCRVWLEPVHHDAEEYPYCGFQAPSTKRGPRVRSFPGIEVGEDDHGIPAFLKNDFGWNWRTKEFPYTEGEN